MTADGFLTNKRRSPVSMGAAIAIQGVVLAGLLTMAAPTITDKVPTVMEVFNVDQPTPPDPIEPVQPQPKAPTSQPTTPDRIIDAPTLDPVIITDLAPLTPIPPGPIVGTGTEPFVPPSPLPTPKPVMVDAMVDPRYAPALQPDYPGAEQRAQIEGKATVRVLIGTDGRVKAVELVSADRPGFFKATEQQALKRWRFKPATRDGVAVESWKQMTVHFRLES
ncbi:protein TonB [Sphingomonas zeicaulis]|uniref:energy transducer TonB n=1 Tax=Sphingomonas zeicaulis TaxID=1632740 RepID=UPI003D230C5A